MPRADKRMRPGRATVLLAGLLLALPAALGSEVQGEPRPVSMKAAVAFPEFEATPCCELCPAAADPSAYASGYLKSFETLIEGRGDWLFRTKEDLKTDFSLSRDGLSNLVRFQAALKAQGVELVIVVQPPRGLMQRARLKPEDRARYNDELAQFSYVAMLQQMRDAGLHVPPLESLVYEGGRGDFFFRADHHWRPEGARRTAKVVAQGIRELPVYAELPKKRFVTTKAGLFAKRGTMDKAAQMLCGYGAPEQYVISYVTVPAEEGGASSLLGDETPPAVTLVGTSNSEPAYNFGGFLQEYLETDILNVAQAGGGLDGAMLDYLPSVEFRENRPKLIIWEVEAYHDLSDSTFYRHAIPLLEGGCEARPDVMADARPLRVGRNEVLFNGDGVVRTLRGEDHVLDLKFSEVPRAPIEAIVWYTNGRDDDIKIEPEDVGPDGRYVTELRTDADYGELSFLSLDINVPPGQTSPLQLESSLCDRRVSPSRTQLAVTGDTP